MWVKGEIALYSVKSDRKNAKSVYKRMQIVGGSEKMKEFYTIYDLYDFAGFIAHAPYHHFKLVAYSNSRCISTLSNFKSFGDIEQTLNLLYEYMRILNFREWDFSLADLHNDPNIRYNIKQYYHPDVK